MEKQTKYKIETFLMEPSVHFLITW